MNKYWWIVGACILTTIAFFIPDQGGHIWSLVSSALVVTGIFYVGLIVYIIKKARSIFEQAVGIGVLLVLTSMVVYSGLLNYRAANWQHQTLLDIRKTIVQGSSLAYTQEPLLHSLNYYHKQEGEKDSTINQIFNGRYGERIKSTDGHLRFIPKGQEGEPDQSPLLFLKQEDGSDSVTVVAQSLHVEGMDSTFRNINGQNGKMQFQAILSKEGVDYERQN